MASVGYATLQIIPSAKGFASKLGREVDAPSRGAGTKAGRSMGLGMGAAALGAARGVIAPIAAVFAGAQILGFAKGAITEASGLNESINALNVTYGKASAGVQQLGKESADALGLSNLEFNNLAVRFSNFANTIAGPSGDVVGTLDDLTTRASDFASVMNLEVADAAALFQSGLAGESEPLRAYGIDLSAATVQSYAYAKGIAKSGEELTQAQKVQATYGSLMEQTAKTAGDFTNTSGELANQQRILGARWANLKGTLGAALLPAMTSVVSALNSGLGPALEKAGPLAQRASDAISGLFAFVTKGDLTGGFLRALGLEEDSAIIDKLFQIRDAVVGVFSSFSGGGGGANPFAGILEGVKAFAASVGPAIGPLLGQIGSLAATIAPILVNLGRSLLSALGPGLAKIGAILGGQVIPAFTAFLGAMRPVVAFILTTIAGALVGALSGAIKVVQGVLTVIGGIFSVFAGILTGDWSRAWEGVKAILSGAVTALIGAVQFLWNFGILRAFSVGFAAIRGIFTAGWAGIRALATAGWNGLRSLFTGGVSALGRAITGGVRTYLGLWRSFFSTVGGIVRNGWSVLRSAFGGALAAIRTVVSSALSAVRSGFSSAFGAITGVVRSALSSVGAALRGLPGTVKNAVSGAAGWLKSAGGDVIRGFTEGIRNMAGTVISAIRSSITDKLPGFVKNALGIASPSRVFREIGGFVGEGMALGIGDGARGVQRAADALVPAAPTFAYGSGANATGGALGRAAAPTPVVVPVQIDGREVGRAVFEVGGQALAYGRLD